MRTREMTGACGGVRDQDGGANPENYRPVAKPGGLHQCALTPRLRLMKQSSARLLVAGLTLGLSGCLAALPPRPPIDPRTAFDPTRFFAGRTLGEGTLDVRVGTDRALRVEGNGRTDSTGTFRLDQSIVFAKGKSEQRVWLLQRIDATHFRATLSDAQGPVRAESDGSRLHLRYLLRHPAVYMEQWMYLQPDGRTVVNLAQVTVLGIPWARLAETITRVDSARR